MTEQNAELSTDERLQQAIEDYGKLQIAKAYDRRSLQPDSFELFWEEIKPACRFELTESNELLINGERPDFYVEYLRRDKPEIRDKYFARPGKEAESSQVHPAPNQQKQASPKTQAPECLYVSKAQLMSREFMLAAGVELTAGIQSGKIRVDDSRAVQNGHEIREFLSPQVVEPAAQKTEIKPAPKTSTISKAQLLDRNFLRKVDAEWSDQGGYLRAVQKGLIRVEG
ncbi:MULTISPECIES: hypothetical protein [Leptolyngbya]|uniref:hypothetical protein n=1 Tax=Leptolyngbya TaxID=47251 RepID=UPI0016850FCB|nr:hypothetical protein [Leptolyngbya sp. FACHB-1624]MBD1857704.1 hypothetical protein [Leptolyngbya sp. FACHB-1624]